MSIRRLGSPIFSRAFRIIPPSASPSCCLGIGSASAGKKSLRSPLAARLHADIVAEEFNRNRDQPVAVLVLDERRRLVHRAIPHHREERWRQRASDKIHSPALLEFRRRIERPVNQNPCPVG